MVGEIFSVVGGVEGDICGKEINGIGFESCIEGDVVIGRECMWEVGSVWKNEVVIFIKVDVGDFDVDEGFVGDGFSFIGSSNVDSVKVGSVRVVERLVDRCVEIVDVVLVVVLVYYIIVEDWVIEFYGVGNVERVEKDYFVIFGNSIVDVEVVILDISDLEYISIRLVVEWGNGIVVDIEDVGIVDGSVSNFGEGRFVVVVGEFEDVWGILDDVDVDVFVFKRIDISISVYRVFVLVDLNYII